MDNKLEWGLHLGTWGNTEEEWYRNVPHDWIGCDGFIDLYTDNNKYETLIVDNVFEALNVKIPYNKLVMDSNKRIDKFKYELIDITDNTNHFIYKSGILDCDIIEKFIDMSIKNSEYNYCNHNENPIEDKIFKDDLYIEEFIVDKSIRMQICLEVKLNISGRISIIPITPKNIEIGDREFMLRLKGIHLDINILSF